MLSCGTFQLLRNSNKIGLFLIVVAERKCFSAANGIITRQIVMSIGTGSSFPNKTGNLVRFFGLAGRNLVQLTFKLSAIIFDARGQR